MSETKHPAEVLADELLATSTNHRADAIAAMLRTIPAMEAERTRLQSDVETLRAELQTARGQAERMEKAWRTRGVAIDALEPDAERYRWITKCKHVRWGDFLDQKQCVTNGIDATIDAVRGV